MNKYQANEKTIFNIAGKFALILLGIAMVFFLAVIPVLQAIGWVVS